MGQKKIKQTRKQSRKTQDQQQRVCPDLYQQAMASGAITSEMEQAYKEMGKQMYETFDYPTATIIEQDECKLDPLSESIAYIKSALSSGLHPDDLENDEKEVMDHYDPKWRDEYI